MSALVEARESLTYWEHRLRTLPRWALGRRREARAMAARWRERVSQAELAEYGPGLIGAAFMLMAERRLPASVRDTSRRVVRTGAIALATVAVSLVALTVLVVAALLVAIF
jgi:hypothetical protein